jgi:hypothetical protein
MQLSTHLLQDQRSSDASCDGTHATADLTRLTKRDSQTGTETQPH